jgi:hypothetical protein
MGLGIRLDHVGVELSQGTNWGWDLLSAGFGYRLTPYASIGLAAKYLFSRQAPEGTGVQAFAADLGAVLEMTPGLKLGLTVGNPVGSFRWDDGENESPPLGIGLGAGVQLPYSVSGDVVVALSDSDPARGGIGMEIPVAMTGFNIRGGYLYRSGDYSRNILTAGFGYAIRTFEVDYAVRVDDELALGTTHHFSLGYMLP